MPAPGLIVRLFVLLSLILNGTTVHGIPIPVESAAAAALSGSGSPHCHSAGDHGESATGAASRDRGSSTDGRDPVPHDCGGAACTCACVHHTPSLALFSAVLDLFSGTSSMLTTARVGFHSVSPLPLLRPPIA